MCVARLPWTALSLSCSGLCVLPHGPQLPSAYCPQPAALSLLPSAWPRGPCMHSCSALGYLVLGLDLIPCVFPPYLGSQPVHFL